MKKDPQIKTDDSEQVQLPHKIGNPGNYNEATINAILCQVVLASLCLVSYVHALNGSFVFDDSVAIVKNTDVTELPTNLSAIFRHDFWGSPLQSADSHKSYRPLTTLMFHLEHAHLGWDAKQMKAINVLLHSMNTLLVWHVLRRLEFKQVPTIQVATIASALFAVHPVHTEPVCGVVGRADLMFGLLYLLALLLTTVRPRKGIRCAMIDIAVLTLTGIGMLFKETAVTISLACVFFDYMRRETYLRSWKEQLQSVLTFRHLGYALTTATLLIVRLGIQNFESPHFKPMDNPVAFSQDALTRILSQHYLYVINLWILLCPQWLSFDWALGCVELIVNAWDLRLQCVLAFYSLVIVTIVNCKHNFGPLLGLGLLVIPFLPASGIIKVGFVIAERVLYVPSIGFCFLVAYAFVYVYSCLEQRWLRTLLKWLLMLLFTCLLLRTRQRANDWLTEDRLFTAALRVCPNNAKVHYNIARLASDKSERNRAFYHYHKAIELFPQYEAALMNLGNLYREKGDLSAAEMYIKAALDVLPEFPAAWMNLGIVQSAVKKYSQALRSYENALRYRKDYAICYYNMGNLFLDQKLYAEAMHHWQEAVALNPRQPKAWANILTMLDNRGLHEDAVRLSAKALEQVPKDTSIMFIRANVFGKLKHYMEAEELYKRVIAVDPLNLLYHTNLGVLYHRWGKTNAAIDSYHRAIELDPEKSRTARDNLTKLLKRIRQEELSGKDGVISYGK